MSDFMTAALFVYTEDRRFLIEQLQKNASGTRITPVLFDDFRQAPQARLEGLNHVVVAGSLDVIKETLALAARYHFSIGIIPAKNQKNFIKFYDLPQNTAAAVDLALRKNGQAMDLIL